MLENPLFEKVLGVLAKEVVSGILSEEDMASSQVCDLLHTVHAEEPEVDVPRLIPVFLGEGNFCIYYRERSDLVVKASSL